MTAAKRRAGGIRGHGDGGGDETRKQGVVLELSYEAIVAGARGVFMEEAMEGGGNLQGGHGHPEQQHHAHGSQPAALTPTR
jgi:hypothetical protein